MTLFFFTRSEILPCLGDHVVARTDLTGKVELPVNEISCNCHP